eukprot:TRINITY_DN15490_c0_g1_i1.p1 TRINITY_DN15490_c0_g1~~TRINITY_DN15490_c0_g1_i1.p1  ORF type:complete len:112 (-),score=4.11 TRINITY_DN15490_c0_g1_i1:107-442(-)
MVHEILQELHKTVRAPNAWEYCPEKSVKSDRGFVGLKNLGSTCYMNSLLQQFYMMPHFRHALIESGVELSHKMTDDECKESLLLPVNANVFLLIFIREASLLIRINFCTSI